MITHIRVRRPKYYVLGIEFTLPGWWWVYTKTPWNRPMLSFTKRRVSDSPLTQRQCGLIEKKLLGVVREYEIIFDERTTK